MILAEVAAVVRQFPPEEAVIIWTFRSRDSSRDEDDAHRELILGALRREGIDTEAKIEVPGVGLRARILVETFGKETATNAYKHCTNVIFTGGLELSRQQVAGMYVAESRDLLMSGGPRCSDTSRVRSTIGALYQAISRAACREVRVDEQGRTQAKPTKVWLMSRHKKVRQELGRVFPGALWTDWAPASRGKTYETKVTRAAREIRELLDQLGEGVTRIASKSLKAERLAGAEDLGQRHLPEGTGRGHSGHSLDAPEPVPRLLGQHHGRARRVDGGESRG